MELLKAGESAPGSEYHFWVAQGGSFSPETREQLQAATISHRALRVPRGAHPTLQESSDLFARFLGEQRNMSLLVALTLGRQIFPRPFLNARLQLSTQDQLRLQSELTYSSTLSQQQSDSSRGCWSRRAGWVQCSRSYRELSLIDRDREVSNGELLAAAAVTVQLQDELLELAAEEGVNPRELLNCFSEGGRGGNRVRRRQSAQRVLLLQQLLDAAGEPIAYQKVYERFALRRAGMVDQLIAPLELLGVLHCFRGFRELLPTEGFLRLQEVFTVAAQEGRIPVNVRRGGRAERFLSFIDARRSDSYRAEEVEAATGLTRPHLQRLHYYLNQTFNFDFHRDLKESGLFYRFTRRPVLLLEGESSRAGRRAIGRIAQSEQLRARQRRRVEQLSVTLEERGYWWREDFQQAVLECWRQEHPDRFTKRGALSRRFTKRLDEETTELAQAYSFPSPERSLHHRQIYFQENEERRPFIEALVHCWERAHRRYQTWLTDAESLRSYFSGQASLGQPLAEWPQGALLEQVSAQRARMSTLGTE